MKSPGMIPARKSTPDTCMSCPTCRQLSDDFLRGGWLDSVVKLKVSTSPHNTYSGEPVTTWSAIHPHL